MKRAFVAVVWGLSLSAIGGACSSGATPPPAPACREFQFRACKDPCGRGVQRCLASGRWGPCSCVAGDASYADVSDAAGQPDQSAPDADTSLDADAAADRGLLD